LAGSNHYRLGYDHGSYPERHHAAGVSDSRACLCDRRLAGAWRLHLYPICGPIRPAASNSIDISAGAGEAGKSAD
jgi:hypothetical protein